MEGGGVESCMMQTVQLSIADGQYAATVRDALTRSCAWHIQPVDRPDVSQHWVMVLDEQSFRRLPLPLSNPERGRGSRLNDCSSRTITQCCETSGRSTGWMCQAQLRVRASRTVAAYWPSAIES